MSHEKYMKAALKEAGKSSKKDEVPVGAVIVHGGKIISRAHNNIINKCDPCGHAEILAIRKAAKKLSNERLLGCTLYTTLEPCAMCAGAIVHSRIKTLVFGADDPKTGACGSAHTVLNSVKNNHQVEIISGILKEDSSAMIRDFFRNKRSNKTPDNSRDKNDK